MWVYFTNLWKDGCCYVMIHNITTYEPQKVGIGTDSLSQCTKCRFKTKRSSLMRNILKAVCVVISLSLSFRPLRQWILFLMLPSFFHFTTKNFFKFKN